MNRLEDELRLKWNSINYHDGGSLQLSVKHPLEWHVRYASRNHKCIVIVTDIPTDNIPSSKSIDASCNLRNDGRYAISFTLVNNEQEDVFISMTSDIIEYSRLESDAKSSLNRVIYRYAAWMKLLEHKRTALLSPDLQKGLLAELIFLKEVIESGIKISDAVEGWVGPEGADQDFVYEDGWHEIKATGRSSSKVTISSVEQLDNPMSGELVVFRADKCAPAHAGAITLYDMVHNLLGMMTANVNVMDDFILKLASAGYIDTDEYKKYSFVVPSKQSYLVNDTFPRLLRINLPTEIVNVEYQLDLNCLSSWAR